MKRICYMLLLSVFLCATALAQTDFSAAGNSDSGISDFPNYHPLIVHFPLVLLAAAALLQIVVLFKQNRLYNYAVTAAAVVGFITALLATTLLHAHPAHNINATAKALFQKHAQLATITLWLSGIASLCKIAGLFTYKKWIETVAFLFLLGSGITVTIAGHYGSSMVYKQGIGAEGQKLEQEHD